MKKPTLKSLFATSKPMRAWLESLPPRAIATPNIFDNCECLGARLMRHHGMLKDGEAMPFSGACHASGANWSNPSWFVFLISKVPKGRVTAARALKVLDEVEGAL